MRMVTMLDRKRHHRELSDEQAAAYNRNGYEIMRDRDYGLYSAVKSHCAGEQIPFLVVRIRRRYCSVHLDLDTLNRQIPTEGFPFAKWASDATWDIREDLRSRDDQIQSHLIYMHKLSIRNGIRLAERIADYLRKAGFGAKPVDVDVIDLASERSKRRPDGPNGAA